MGGVRTRVLGERGKRRPVRGLLRGSPTLRSSCRSTRYLGKTILSRQASAANGELLAPGSVSGRNLPGPRHLPRLAHRLRSQVPSLAWRTRMPNIDFAAFPLRGLRYVTLSGLPPGEPE